MSTDLYRAACELRSAIDANAAKAGNQPTRTYLVS